MSKDLNKVSRIELLSILASNNNNRNIANRDDDLLKLYMDFRSIRQNYMRYIRNIEILHIPFPIDFPISE